MKSSVLSEFILLRQSIIYFNVIADHYHTNFGQKLGPIAQLVASPNAVPGVGNLTPARPHTFMEIEHEIISTVILLLKSIDSRRVVC